MEKLRIMKRLPPSLSGSVNTYLLQRARIMASRVVSIPGIPEFTATISRFLEANGWKYDGVALRSRLASENNEYPLRCLCALHGCVAAAYMLALGRGEEVAVQCADAVRILGTEDIDDAVAQLSPVAGILATDADYIASDRTTRRACLSRVERYAQTHRISESEAAEILLARGIFNRERSPARLLYFPAWALCIAVFCAAFCLASAIRSPIPLFLCLLPLADGAKQVCDRLAGRLVRHSPVPRMNIEAVPSDGRTLTVITALLSGSDDRLFRQLERHYLSDTGENIIYGILADLPDSDSPDRPGDLDIIECAKKSAAALEQKYNRPFPLFIRRRSWCQTEARFIGWERKRGALIELTRFITGDPTGFSVAPEPSLTAEIKYVVTLDSDTCLYLGAITDMVAAMLHPANRPVLHDGALISGSAIMQPRMEPSAESACATAFSSLCCGDGGFDAYGGDIFELYSDVFGEGSYCGKGIFDVETCSVLLDGAFPDGTVLSHDLLEGARTGTVCLSEVALTDDCPSAPRSYYRRQHRWIRGDIQALAFAGAYVRDAEGMRRPNPASPLSQFKLVDNLRRALTPVMSVAALIFAALVSDSPREAFFIAFAALLPPVVSLFSSLVPPLRGNVATSLRRLLYSVSAMPKEAFVSADAIVRALWRICVSHRHMLEWTTAAAEKNGVPALSAVMEAFPSFICGFILLLSPLRGMYVLAGLWIVYPIIALLIGYPRRPAPTLSDVSRTHLREYAAEMWSFFSETAGRDTHYLPPDNLQLLPTPQLARRTSPTNIGMYLLSVLAARDLGFITTPELYGRTRDCVSSLMRLPRYRGHLYNWYSTDTLEVIGRPFVSTADSGNFSAAASAVAAGLREYADGEPRLNEVAAYLSAMAREADFSFLCDPRRHFLSVGYDTVEGKLSDSCYDLLISESRIASFYAIAFGDAGRELWRRLGRPRISRHCNSGIASWSGTMFEYFMPALFLPSGRGTLLREALGFAICEQQRHAVTPAGSSSHVWGVSESCYFEFDADMNYQYRAFGVGSLALRSDTGGCAVISPYSSFLAMALAPRAAMANLTRLERLGMRGRHGFYEALDCDSGRVGEGMAVIRSYMAHHVGMSLVAAANVLDGERFVKRFCSYPEVASALSLLEERIPPSPLFRGIREPSPEPRSENLFTLEKPAHDSGTSVTAAVVSAGRIRAVGDSEGGLYFAEGKRLISRPLYSPGNASGATVLFIADDKATVVNAGTLYHDPPETHMRYENEGYGIRTSLDISVTDSGCIRLCLTAQGDFSEACPVLAFEPVLAPEAEYTSHPAFSALSLEAFFDSDRGILSYRQRSRDPEKDGGDRWLAVAFGSVGMPEFSTRRDSLLPPMYGEAELYKALEGRFGSETGACVHPYCALRKRSSGCRGKYSCVWLIAVGRSLREVTAMIETERRRRPRRDTLVRRFNSPVADYITLLTECLIFRRGGEAKILHGVRGGRELFWKYSISGDLPVVAVCVTHPFVSGDSCHRTLTAIIAAHRHLMLSGMRFDLLILYRETDRYNRTVGSAISDIAEEVGSRLLLGFRGGIRLCCEADEADADALCESACAVIRADGSQTFGETAAKLRAERVRRTDDRVVSRVYPCDPVRPGKRLQTYGGAFVGGGFEIDKSAPVRTPWSYPCANRSFGTLLTQYSLGYSWYGNCRIGRLTLCDADVLSHFSGERLTVELPHMRFDVCACAGRVFFGGGTAEYNGEVEGVSYTAEVGVDRRLRVKLIRLRLGKELPAEFELKPVLGGDGYDPRLIVTRRRGNVCFFDNLGGESAARAMTGFLIILGCPGEISDDYGFVLGAFPSGAEDNFEFISAKFRTPSDITAELDRFRAECSRELSGFTLSSGHPTADLLFNHFIPYQTVFCRMRARCGFWQSGGAYGFRDQLQDCLCLMRFAPNEARAHILRAAAHQYPEGDVMHWWHTYVSGPAGIRGNCSDDLLWLPYVTAAYVKFTGDTEILEAVIPYVSSNQLAEGENDRYERPSRSRYRESLYLHCARAIEHAMRFGVHRLLLIGGGDWNDGMNRIGNRGRGESLWLSRFMCMVLDTFIPICDIMSDPDAALSYCHSRAELAEACERAGWAGDRYLRGYHDDGLPIGSPLDSECRTDLISQAFSAMAEPCSNRSLTAMTTAARRLFDPGAGIFKLFEPPVSASASRDYGYIRGYADGLRENGGQYTHGAIWGACGAFAAKMTDLGWQLLLSLLPSPRPGGNSADARYGAEPYVLAADVYAAEGHIGRGGWSWYTGAAGWYHTLLLCYAIGYREDATGFTLTPTCSPVFGSYSLTVNRHGTVYRISVRIGDKSERLLDGEPAPEQFIFDKTEHFIQITVENGAALMYNGKV